MRVQFPVIFSGAGVIAHDRTTRSIRVPMGHRLTASWLILVALLWMGLGAAQVQSQTAEVATTLPHMQLVPAPEFPTDLQWLNTARPLQWRDLRGKMVLLDFWTYGCINCLHILPDLKRLETTYARELVVIGVHTAKYENEAVLANLRQAIRRYGSAHPVVNDHDSRLWNAYRISGWPTQILIDPTGHVLQGFIGEYHVERLSRLIASTIEVHRQRGTLRETALVTTPEVEVDEPTRLRYPGKILADIPTSRLFIADTQHHRVVVADLQGTVLHVIGRGVAGAADGTYPGATFRQPQGMALHRHRLYVADTNNHWVRVMDLQTQEVRTLLLRGLIPPQPLAESPDKSTPSDRFELGEVMRLSEQSLPAQTQTNMRIALHAPSGWQVNGRAPGLVEVTVQGTGAVVPATYLKQTIRPMVSELDIPLQTTASGAAAWLRVDLSFVLCRKGDQAVCVPRQVAWEVPIRSQSQAAQTTLLLHDRMVTIAREFAD